MRSVLSAVALVSALVLPLAAHADTYTVSNITVVYPSGDPVTLASSASNQAISNYAGIVLSFAPTGSGSESDPLGFKVTVNTAYGAETIFEDGSNSYTYAPGFDSAVFSPTTPTITGPAEYNVVFSSNNSTGNGANETIYVELYNNSGFVPPAATPEPTSLALLGTGLVGIAGIARRKFLNR